MTTQPTTHAAVLPLFSPAAQQPTKRYRTIVADPPWQFDQSWGENYLAYRSHSPGTVNSPNEGRRLKRGAAANYPVMTIDEIKMIPVGIWAANDSHLYLWTTNSHIRLAFDVMEAWGFKYKTMLTWCKNKIGMGTYFRNTTEHVLFGVRGSLGLKRHDIWTHFNAPRHAHSEKPDTFYDIVQSASPGPYLDVFARKQRFGFDTWGDEAFDFRTHGIWHKEEAL